MYWSKISSAAFVDFNQKKVATLNTECDNLILCSLSNNTGLSARLFMQVGPSGLDIGFVLM